MMTIKFALIAMIIGFSTYAPLHIENINTPIEHPKAQIEAVQNTAVAVHTDVAAPAEKAETKTGVNQDKTYEQVMNEAFERLYEEINRLLDQIPEDCKEQFQLQNMMR